MNKTKFAILVLSILLIVETSLLAADYVHTPYSGASNEMIAGASQTFGVPFDQFNQPISNDTEYNLTQSFEGSWVVTIQGDLIASGENQSRSEAQIAFAPEYVSENLSIPTIIVQEKADGRLRIEYFAQDWPRTYGLVLYNSSSPSWINNNVTLQFISFAPPVEVNPQLAPRPNGNLTITVGGITVLSEYPIAWAGLSSFYVYGLLGSNFTSGSLYITAYSLKPRS